VNLANADRASADNWLTIGRVPTLLDAHFPHPIWTVDSSDASSRLTRRSRACRTDSAIVGFSDLTVLESLSGVRR